MKNFLIILMLLFVFSPTAISAPPTAVPNSVTADCVKVIKELNRRYQRQKRERRAVASLFRELVGQHKFQFEAFNSLYHTSLKKSNVTVRSYGGRIIVSDDKYNPKEQPTTELEKNNLNRNPVFGNIEYSTRGWYTNTIHFNVDNFRDQNELMFFDVLIEAPIRTPQQRWLTKTRLEFRAGLYTGEVAMRVLFLNDSLEVIESGPIYYGYLNVLR